MLDRPPAPDTGQQTFLPHTAWTVEAMPIRRGEHDAITVTVPATETPRICAGTLLRVQVGRRSVMDAIATSAPVASTGPPPKAIVCDVGAAPGMPAALLYLCQWAASYYRCPLGTFLAGVLPAVSRSSITAAQQHAVRVTDRDQTGLTPRRQAVLAALSASGGAPSVAEACRITRAGPTTVQALLASGHLAMTPIQRGTDMRLEAAIERHPLTAEQAQVIEAIHTAPPPWRPHLLHGVTGSGKTLVYLELAERVIARGQTVLFLVPEIALTPQLAARIRTRFARVAVVHSAVADGERADTYRSIAARGVDLVIGARSALFAPLHDIGMIIVDEEHDHSYKQDVAPRYQARDLAIKYGHQLGVPVILGSATPACETYHHATCGRYAYHRLEHRPGAATLPQIHAVDMRAHQNLTLSPVLVDQLTRVRDRHEQAIILLNRRGWSPRVFCRACGQGIMCDACDVGMTHHRHNADLCLKCHLCGAERPLPRQCPACGADAVGTAGVGTQSLAAAVAAAVPGLRIARLDSDVAGGRGAHVDLLRRFGDGSIDCIVGTQMVAKGLDFPRVSLVGVVGADLGLGSPDFRAGERVYQLVSQVAGRAGRSTTTGQCLVQAWDPEQPCIAHAVQHDAHAFYASELAIRREYGYPPFSALIRVEWSSPVEALAERTATEQGRTLIDRAMAMGAVVLGPTIGDPARVRGWFRMQALVKAPSRSCAQRILDAVSGALVNVRQVAVTIDVDPMQMG